MKYKIKRIEKSEKKTPTARGMMKARRAPKG